MKDSEVLYKEAKQSNKEEGWENCQKEENIIKLKIKWKCKEEKHTKKNKKKRCRGKAHNINKRGERNKKTCVKVRLKVRTLRSQTKTKTIFKTFFTILEFQP